VAGVIHIASNGEFKIMIKGEQMGMNGGECEIFQVTFPEFSLKY
jgi:hypothetical protein